MNVLQIKCNLKCVSLSLCLQNFLHNYFIIGFGLLHDWLNALHVLCLIVKWYRSKISQRKSLTCLWASIRLSCSPFWGLYARTGCCSNKSRLAPVGRAAVAFGRTNTACYENSPTGCSLSPQRTSHSIQAFQAKYRIDNSVTFRVQSIEVNNNISLHSNLRWS